MSKNVLFSKLCGLIWIGRILGILPLKTAEVTKSEVPANTQTNSRSHCQKHNFFCWLVTLFLCINPAVGIYHFVQVPKRNPFEIAGGMKIFFCTVWVVIIHLIFIVKRKHLVNIFHSWQATAQQIQTAKDVTLARDAALITGIVFTSAILESGLAHWNYFRNINSTEKQLELLENRTSKSEGELSPLQAYYQKSHPQWATYFEYHWFLAVIAFVEHKLFLCCWNWVDVFIAVLGRGLYFKFKSVYEEAEKRLLGPRGLLGVVIHGTAQISQDSRAWQQLVKDHKSLCRLVEIVDEFLSSLIFGSYAVNIFYICIALLYSVILTNKDMDAVAYTYTIWCIVHLTMRTFIVSVSCSRIGMYAAKTRTILEECPIEVFRGEVKRLYQKLTNNNAVGLTGLGCFVVTKSFMLSIIGVVITFEVVLLQCIPLAK